VALGAVGDGLPVGWVGEAAWLRPRERGCQPGSRHAAGERAAVLEKQAEALQRWEQKRQAERNSAANEGATEASYVRPFLARAPLYRRLPAGPPLRQRAGKLLVQRFHEPAISRRDAGATEATSPLLARETTNAAVGRRDAGATSKLAPLLKLSQQQNSGLSLLQRFASLVERARALVRWPLEGLNDTMRSSPISCL
jgi:hypothetical protein